MAKYVLAIDQGTTGSTVALLDEGACIRAKVNHEYRQIFPQPGWVEHDPEDIWQSVLAGIRKCMKLSLVNPNDIAAIGITNQRETVVAWNRNSGKTYYNAIVWQCRRTAKVCSSLKRKGLEPMIQKKTGLLLDPYFSASKMQWMIQNLPSVKEASRRGELCFGTIDSYLIWRLTGGKTHKIDVSNASRTMLMNIDQVAWDDELLKLFSVPKTSLPQIVPSSGELGRTVDIPSLVPNIPIAGVAGDQQAALFGQLCFRPGEAKCTFGTGSFLLLNTGNLRIVPKSGCLSTVAWQLSGESSVTYALEGGAFICGAAVQWLRDGLGLIDKSSDIESLAQSVDSTDGVEFVPALTGLGAPYWDSEARGLISGLTRGTTKAHLARATLESMALQNVDLLRAMEVDLGRKLKTVRVDGGASANNFLMQKQADFLGVPIVRPKVVETTVMGAAFLAGLGVGLWKNLEEIGKVWQLDQEFLPEITNGARTQRLRSWHLAISRTRIQAGGEVTSHRLGSFVEKLPSRKLATQKKKKAKQSLKKLATSKKVSIKSKVLKKVKSKTKAKNKN
jgi:glycerol kinase